MAICATCGAQLKVSDLACAYCQAATPAGAARRQEEERQRQLEQGRIDREAHAQKREAEARAAKDAQTSLKWSVAGFFFWCFLLPSIVGSIFAARATMTARKFANPVPVKAIVALILNGLSLGTFVAFAIYVVTDQIRLNREKTTDTVEIAPHLADATLDRTTACTMAKLFLLDDRFAGVNGNAVNDYECAGEVVQTGERAVVDDIHFRGSAGGPRIAVAACFHKSAMWLVDELRTDHRCDAAAAASSEPAHAASAPATTKAPPGGHSPHHEANPHERGAH